MSDILKEKRTVKILSIVWLALYITVGLATCLWTAIYMRHTGNSEGGIYFAAIILASLIIVFIPLAAIIHRKSRLAGMKAIRIVSKVLLIITSILAAQTFVIIIAALVFLNN